VVTARGTSEDIVSRVFVPYLGIDEDPVTGSAHAALVPYWAERLGRTEFTALQASARTGILHCRLDGDRVILGGRCQTVIVGQFQL
jgi:predicted PhzF superfamily epimerase YddE/YHI9